MGGDNIKAIAAGLPNIQGSFIEFNASMGDIIIQKEGSFFDGGRVNKTNEHYLSPSSANVDFGFKTIFNASYSNVIYGASSTVQPPAIMLLPQIKY